MVNAYFTQSPFHFKAYLRNLRKYALILFCQCVIYASLNINFWYLRKVRKNGIETAYLF